MTIATRARAAIAALLLIVSTITVREPAHASMPVSAQATADRRPQAKPVPVLSYEVVNTFPHDPAAFTQGLIYRDGHLFESTGLKGQSSLRKVKLETGAVVERRVVDKRYFAEGLTDWGNRLLQLTWETSIGFIYDVSTFEPVGTFTYTGEGWGLTHDSSRLIMSDGTSALRFLDPSTQREIGRITVKDGDRPIERLNELEFIKGEVYANVWLTDRIAIISPATGRVTAWLDLVGLRRGPAQPGNDVLNGIAYDAQRDRLFVTGKLWPTLYEIRVRR
jgi:glutaminyl-peptide cyclotransferase